MKQGHRYQWMTVQPGEVACFCWCSTEIVHTPAAWVGTRTDTCGRRGCTEPEESP